MARRAEAALARHSDGRARPGMPRLGARAARGVLAESGGSPRQVTGGWPRSGVGSRRWAWERGEDKVGFLTFFLYFRSFYFPPFRLYFVQNKSCIY
jgi:hypothetical protein